MRRWVWAASLGRAQVQLLHLQLAVAAQALVVQPAQVGIDLVRVRPVDRSACCRKRSLVCRLLLRRRLRRRLLLVLLLVWWGRLLLPLLLLLLLMLLLLPLLLLLLLLRRVCWRVGGPQRSRRVWVLAGQRHRQLASR